MFKHILFATDGSSASEHATALAIEMATQYSAKLSVLYVVDPYPFLGIGEVNPVGFSAYIEGAQAMAMKAHQHVVELCKKSPSKIEPTLILLEDVAASEGIVRTANSEHCDLIVLGSHGRSGLGRLMLGSVAMKVIHESPVPVLLSK